MRTVISTQDISREQLDKILKNQAEIAQWLASSLASMFLCCLVSVPLLN